MKKKMSMRFFIKIVVCDLKVGRYRLFIKFMSFCKYKCIEDQCHYLTLAKDHLHKKFKTLYSHKPLHTTNQARFYVE